MITALYREWKRIRLEQEQNGDGAQSHVSMVEDSFFKDTDCIEKVREEPLVWQFMMENFLSMMESKWRENVLKTRLSE